jgi:cell division protease FtsH
MANALMKYETIDSGQLDQLLAREDVSAPEGWDDQDRNSSGSDIDGNASAASADDQATVAESDLDADNSDVPGADEAPS